MATPRLVTVRDFNTSRFSQLADTTTANVSDILARAEAAVERQLARPIYPTTFTETFQRPSKRNIFLRQRPIIAITSVTRSYSETSSAIALTGYTFDKDLGVVGLPSTALGGYITVTYTAGFSPTPEDIKEAILIQAALFAYQDLEIYGSGDSKDPGILYMYKDIDRILCPYKQVNLAYSGY